MHGVLTLTSMHDRHLSTTTITKRSATEEFHWYQAIDFFNYKLSAPIHPSERDALWAAAALLGILTLCHLDAKTPEEAWPLKEASALDLNWLKMTEGKNEVCKICEPSRIDSVFHPVSPEYLKSLAAPEVPVTANSPWERPVLEALSPDLINLCDLSNTSNAENNPYYTTAFSLAQVLNVDGYQSTIVNFLSFISHMDSAYKRLLERKDPCALLLLAYWYANVC